MKLKKDSILNIYVPLVLFLFAFIWKFLFINHRDICLDEPFTIFHAQSGLKDILLLPTQDEPNPPLFMVLLHFWIKLFGTGPYAVRTLPILFNALTVPFLYLVGKRFFSVWTGVLASGLFIFSTLHFFFGADTRAYAMLSFAAAASLYYFLSVIKPPHHKYNLVGLIIANFILIYSHYFGWFVVFVQFLSSFLFLKEKQGLKKIWISFIITGISYLPMAGVLIKQFFSSSKGTWLQPPVKSDYINQLQWFLNSGVGFRLVIIILVIGIAISLISKIKVNNWKEILVLLIWWLVPYSIMFFISDKIPMFTNRYILFNSIGFYLFIGAATYFLYNKIKFLLPIITILILAVTFWKLETRDFAVREIKKSTDYTRSKIIEGSAIIIYPQWASLNFTYYFNPEIFKQTEQYYAVLQENGIIPAWGLEDALNRLKKIKHNRIIYYTDNAIDIDHTNSIYNYLDSAYQHVDSATFQGGLKVNVFDSYPPINPNNSN